MISGLLHIFNLQQPSLFLHPGTQFHSDNYLFFRTGCRINMRQPDGQKFER